MYQPLYVRIKGVLPQLMHNGRLKNPLDPWAKAIKGPSKKRTKTDEDHIAMMEAEFKGSLYLLDDDDSKKGYNGKVPYWPADNIHACIKTQAKQERLGKVIDSSVLVQQPGGRLIYDGPKTRNSLWGNEAFRLVKPTKRGVMCCRPKFENWEVEFSLTYLDENINGDDLKKIIGKAGKYIGLSDWTRRWGLFKVVEMRDEEVKIDVRAKRADNGVGGAE